MKHKLEFVKISPEHEIAGVGFAGNIFITLSALSFVNDEDRLYVDMETNECICTVNTDTLLHNTNNSWEYYFDQVKINNDDEVKYMDSMVRGDLIYNDINSFMNPKDYINLKIKFFNNFKIKQYIIEEINEFYKNKLNGKITLGVQIRLTDYTHGGHNFPPFETYLNRINEILLEKPEIEQIFLATDDGKVIPKLKESLDIPILYWEDMFRADDINLHLNPYDRLESNRDLHRYIMGIECMKEIFTLTKCDYFLRSKISAVSLITTILSENIKKIYNT
jgi:hypothetical protein